MWQLVHFALCPVSRQARLLLGEKRVPFELIHVAPWEPQPVYPLLKHSKLAPVLHDTDSGLVLADSRVICEFIEEAVTTPSMVQGSPEQRAEVRRLIAWADDRFYGPLSLPLLTEAFGAGG